MKWVNYLETRGPPTLENGLQKLQHNSTVNYSFCQQLDHSQIFKLIGVFSKRYTKCPVKELRLQQKQRNNFLLHLKFFLTKNYNKQTLSKTHSNSLRFFLQFLQIHNAFILIQEKTKQDEKGGPTSNQYISGNFSQYPNPVNEKFQYLKQVH